MADNEGDTLDVAALTAPPSMPPPLVPNVPSLSPSQQSVVNQLQQQPNMQPIFNPTGAINTTSPVGGALSSFLTQNKVDVAGIAAQQGAINAGTAKQIQGIQETADAQAAITSIKEATARRVQEMDAKDRAMFGITGDGGAASIVGLSAALRTNETTRQALAADVSQKLGVSFFDNPIQYIVNRFTLPNEIGQLEMAEGTVSQSLAVMKGIDQLMSERHADNELAAADHSLSLETQERALVYGQAKIKLGETLAEAARQNISLLNIRTAATRGQFEAVLQANAQNMQTTQNAVHFVDLAAQDQQRGMQQQQLDMEHIRLGMQQDQDKRAAAAAAQEKIIRDLQIGDEQRKLAARTAFQAQLDKAGILFNTRPPSVEILNAMTDSKLKQFWLRAAADPNIQDGHYGYDITTSLEALDTLGISPAPGVAMVQQKLNTVVQGVVAKQPLVWKSLPEIEQHRQLETALKGYVNEQNYNVPDSGGLFSPGSLSSILAIPYVQQSEIGKQMAGIAAANPEHPLSAQEVMASAALSISQKRMNIGQAVDEITNIYNAAIADANQKYNYKVMGFDGPSFKSGFHTTVNLGGGFKSTANIDMTNAGAVYDALLKMMVRQSISEGAAGSTSMLTGQ